MFKTEIPGALYHARLLLNLTPAMLTENIEKIIDLMKF